MKLMMVKKVSEIHPNLIMILDVSLILYAENGLNPSSFAARAAASTQADFYSCIASAIGTLKGDLHNDAAEATLDFL